METEKRVYISADYDQQNGDTEVVDVLKQWSEDSVHKIHFVDMAEVRSGSVASDPDCRICELKAEFNRQINQSSAVIIIVGDMTAKRTAGNTCQRMKESLWGWSCTPYKQNTNGLKSCKAEKVFTPGPNDDLGEINSFSYLEHEFRQAKRKGKKIIVVYNSLRKEPRWLPEYLEDYEDKAQPFWIEGFWGRRGNYDYIKEALGYV